MPKFLKAATVESPAVGTVAVGALCPAGEWVTAGSFAVCDLAKGYQCDPPCGCDKTFFSLDCRSRCPVAEVVELGEGELATLTAQLTTGLHNRKAPDDEKDAARARNPEAHLNEARKIAEREISNTLALAGSFPTQTRIAVKRIPGPDGGMEELYWRDAPATPELPTTET